jgi:hypothetical protein
MIRPESSVILPASLTATSSRLPLISPSSCLTTLYSLCSCGVLATFDPFSHPEELPR